MSSQYFTKNITVCFEDHNYGDVPISTTDYLSDVINKAINLTSFDPSLFVSDSSQKPTLQESLFGILMVGPGNRVIDFIAFNSKEDIVEKAHVRIDDRPRHKWTHNGEVRKIEDIPFHNMKDMHLIADPSLLPKCFTVIDSHCNMEWLLRYNKVLPPANVKRQYRRGRDIYMRELGRVLHKKTEYNRPQVTDAPSQDVVVPPQDTVKTTVSPKDTIMSPQDVVVPSQDATQDTPQDNNNDSVSVITESKFPILKMMTDSSNIEHGYHPPGKK